MELQTISKNIEEHQTELDRKTCE